MYKPRVLAERLGVPLDVLELALEETGYYKAVQIRGDLIKLKTKLKDHSRYCSQCIENYGNLLRHYKRRKRWIDLELEHVRDILRRPRERPRTKEQQHDDYNRDMNSVIDQAGKETRCGTTSEK